MSVPQIIVVCVIAFILLCARLSRYDERYAPFVGYGWKLGWRQGRVVVLSRLLKSPSGRAKVRMGSVVLEFAGHPMKFESAEEFKAFMETLPRPAIGEVQAFRILDDTGEHVVELVAETIYPPIPYYSPLPPLDDPAERYLFKHGMFICERTGQVVHTRSLTDSAIRGLG